MKFNVSVFLTVIWREDDSYDFPAVAGFKTLLSQAAGQKCRLSGPSPDPVTQAVHFKTGFQGILLHFQTEKHDGKQIMSIHSVG